jgi:hypothetical protein
MLALVAEMESAPLYTSNLEAFHAMIAAWGAGEFASIDSPAYAKFFAPNMTFDASAAAGLHPIFRKYEGYTGFKVWLDMLAEFMFMELDIKGAKGPKTAPDTVVQKYSSILFHKAGSAASSPAPRSHDDPCTKPAQL